MNSATKHAAKSLLASDKPTVTAIAKQWMATRMPRNNRALQKNLLAACVLLVLGCATTRSYQPIPVSAEAANLIQRASENGPGFGLMIDLELMREMGLLQPPKPKSADPKQQDFFSNLLLWSLPTAAVMQDDPKTKQLLSDLTVFAAILSEWETWPNVQRIALIGPTKELDPAKLVESVVIAFAVDTNQVSNSDVLRGFAALHRSTHKESGEEIKTAFDDGKLCISNHEIPMPVCIKGGNGFYAIGTAKALSQDIYSAPSTAPKTEVPSVFRMHLEMDPPVGKISLALTGKTAIQLSLDVESMPEVADSLEKEMKKGLASFDQMEKEKQKIIGAVLEETRSSIAKDSQAPDNLKKAASQVTVNGILDRQSFLAQTRQSVRIEKNGNKLTASATIPEGQIKEWAKQVNDHSFSGLLSASLLSTVLSSSFGHTFGLSGNHSFDSRHDDDAACRSKQGEAPLNLSQAYSAQKSILREKKRYAKTMAQLNFKPAGQTNFTYCTGTSCLPCTEDGCYKAEGANPCKSFEKSALLCAFADLDGDPSKLDLWIVDKEGQTKHLKDDCP